MGLVTKEEISEFIRCIGREVGGVVWTTNEISHFGPFVQSMSPSPKQWDNTIINIKLDTPPNRGSLMPG